jgi:hypothetical protein
MEIPLVEAGLLARRGPTQKTDRSAVQPARWYFSKTSDFRSYRPIQASCKLGRTLRNLQGRGFP